MSGVERPPANEHRRLRCVCPVAAAAGVILLSAPGRAAEIDLTKAVVVAPAELSKPERKAVAMLVEEVRKRTLVRWDVRDNWPNGDTPAVAVLPARVFKDYVGPHKPPQAPGRRKEGYRLVTSDRGAAPAVFVIGNDDRGVLFGVGGLLRELHMTRGKVTLAGPLDINTAPKYPLRGHQLGYRPKTNSYDAWDLPQWEQYIRDLAVFGTNAVELIPPRSDDARDSPHFPRPPLEMMAGMSKLLDDYGLDVWIWYPALDKDYADPATVDFALKEWGEVFKALPRIDAVFVPGGDPGHTQPKVLMALLQKQTENLHRYHPKAQMWVSPQGFTQPWMEEFFAILRDEQPAWLSGVVYGPQVRGTLPELRKAVPTKYPIRRYPDITHSVQCQYPVPDWDTAFAITLARECINPRPLGEAVIFRAYQNDAIGFLTYSEGCNDDVNKFVWSGLGWDPDATVIDLLRQYSRYFIGARYADPFAQGLLALERNWRGPLVANEGVDTTLQQFQDMEKTASPQVRANWRFQQALYRAYYDAYQRRRLLYETELENQATDRLRSARRLGSAAAMNQAEAVLDRAVTEKVAAERRARVFELAEALFQSIQMQLSVPRYQAISVDRGANLDTIDVPLNNRNWLERRFADLRRLESESERLQGIETILNWTDPGPGGFYDDLGNIARQPHLVRGPGFAKDPATMLSPRVGFAYRPDRRMAHINHAEPLYDAPLQMRYTALDRKARYKLRAVYAGDNFRVKMRLVANDTTEIHPFIAKDPKLRPVEFDIPPVATRTGTLLLSWSQEPGRGGNGRGCQVAEVWLMRK